MTKIYSNFTQKEEEKMSEKGKEREVEEGWREEKKKVK